MIGLHLPTPDLDSGSQRLVRLMQMIGELGHEATFLATDPHPGAHIAERYDSDRSALQSLGVNIPEFQSVEDFLSEKGKTFDIVHMVYLPVVYHSMDAAVTYASQAATVFDTVDLVHLRLYRLARLTGNRKMLERAIRAKKQEMEMFRRTDFTLVVSEQEKEIVENLCPGTQAYVVPTSHMVSEDVPPFSDRAGLLFLGNFHHHPNEDAMVHFIREIFPAIKGRLRGVKLTIIGAEPPEKIRKLAGEDINVTGYVPEIDDYFNSRRVFVAPLRYGAGIKGKVLEAMGRGLPVVMTPAAAEGMSIGNGMNGLVASGPEEFADAVVRLYGDDDLWESISRNSLETVRRHFSSQATKERLSCFLNIALERESAFGKSC